MDAGVTSKFPGSAVVVGSAASGAGDNREIPIEEGGDIDKAGRQVILFIVSIYFPLS